MFKGRIFIDGIIVLNFLVADDSVDENDHVFYSQYVSKMGENNQRRTSDTGAGQQHQDNTNLINYAPMAQFPPLPNREPTPKTTAVTREKSYSSAREKSKVSSTNDQTQAKGNINEQGQNGLDGGETRRKDDEQLSNYPVYDYEERMYTDLNFVMVNVQGLSGKCGNKLETDELREISKNNDVVLFTETWGNDYTKFDVRDFTHVALNRTEIKANSKRASGGIVIYIKESLIKYGKDKS